MMVPWTYKYLIQKLVLAILFLLLNIFFWKAERRLVELKAAYSVLLDELHSMSSHFLH
jgi:hypothetical protein